MPRVLDFYSRASDFGRCAIGKGRANTAPSEYYYQRIRCLEYGLPSLGEGE